MRIWSLHPRYLDRAGLTACWREALLARKVLMGNTKGYTRHPQLERFRACPAPFTAIDTYLGYLWEEAARRGYRFDSGKFSETDRSLRIAVTEGQIRYEYDRLRDKLARRQPEMSARMEVRPSRIDANPLFTIVSGGVESWEKISGPPIREDT